MSVITPSGGGASDETRKVTAGWRAMMNQNGGQKQPQQQNRKVIQETAAPASNRPKVDTFEKSTEEEPNGQFDSRRAKKFLTEKYKAETQAKKFKGPENLVLLKMCTLFENEKRPKINYIKEAGFGVYEVSWTDQ